MVQIPPVWQMLKNKEEKKAQGLFRKHSNYDIQIEIKQSFVFVKFMLDVTSYLMKHGIESFA